MNSAKLKAKIVEEKLTQTKMAELLDLSVQNFNAKLNGRGTFNINEVAKMIKILKIDNISEIFFD